jgi:alanine dehydrogenase
MLILNASQVRQALPMAQVIEVMKDAYAALSSGRAEVPLRSQLPIPAYDGVNLYMPAHLADGGESLVIKIVSVYPKNVDWHLPIIHATVLASDPQSGAPLALLEGASLTAIRTGAAAGAATDLLARPDSRIVAIFGAGVQGRTQLEAICNVRQIERAWIFDPKPERIDKFITDLSGRGPIPSELIRATNSKEAVQSADIICTATTSAVPVFDDGDLKPGVHINGFGSFTPQMREVPSETVRRARIFIDSRATALAEAGDLIQPLEAGQITIDQIAGEIGEVIQGRISGRQTHEEITFFKSVGVAVQDAAAARLALENASRLGLGQQVDW